MSEKQSVVSAIPGIFYRRPSPEEDVYVKEGQEVKAGDTIGLVEVMKNFYEVKVDGDGVVDSFLAEDQQLVDAGQEVAILVLK
jgi:acetyl-CoA carboxylase biotin carboxyl carrier protein